jgi:hypothetical protein
MGNLVGRLPFLMKIRSFKLLALKLTIVLAIAAKKRES